jgi:hypothetical protein
MNTPKIIKTRTLLLSAMLLALSLPLAAQESAASAKTDAPSVRMVSAEAQAVIDRMSAYLHSLKSFQIESYSSRDEVTALGFKLQNNEHSTLTVSQPNKLHSMVTGDIRNRTYIYDGSQLTIYSPEDQVYTRVSGVPGTLPKLVGGLLNAGIEMPLIDVLYQAGAGTLTEDVRGGILVGESMIDGVACDHLAFRQATIDWQLWVEKGARPLPRKLVITTRYEVGDPQYQANLCWDLQPKIDSATFVFTPPKGVNEIPYNDPASLKEAAPAGDR